MFKRFQGISIFWQIFTGFIVVVILIFTINALNFLQLDGLRNESQKISPYGQQLDLLQQMAIDLANFEANLDRYFVMGSTETLASIYNDIDSLVLTGEEFAPLIAPHGSLEELTYTEQLLNDITQLKNLAQTVFSNTSAQSQNRQLLELLDEVENLKVQQRQLTELTLQGLAELAITQVKIANNVTLQLLLLTLVVGIVATFVSLFLSRRISRQLSYMVDAATAIADGNLAARIALQSENEIGMLGNAFNNMAAQLERLVEGERSEKKRLEKIVSQYTHVIQQVAGGNLNAQVEIETVEMNDESQDDLHVLGISLNNMVLSMRTLTTELRDTALDVSAVAAEILSAATQQNVSTTEQQASVSQTMATVQEVQTTVSQTAARAQTVAEAAQHSVEVSVDGTMAVEDAVDGMKVIQERVEAIAENILALSGRTQQIGEIINTVNDIANQSKLLALNASIEAARAGAEGRGLLLLRWKYANWPSNHSKLPIEFKRFLKKFSNLPIRLLW